MHFDHVKNEKEKRALQKLWAILEQTHVSWHIDPFELEQFFLNLASATMAERAIVQRAIADLIVWDQ
jgi:hypothetical protein